MNDSLRHGSSRRAFLRLASTLATAPLLGYSVRALPAEPPPETRRIRLIRTPSICIAPQYLAEELLRLEGFTDIQYVDIGSEVGGQVLASNRADLTIWDLPSLIPLLDVGRPIVLLAGIHVGCYELFASHGIRSIRELKGKTVAISAPNDSEQVLLSSMLAYVGIDPRTEVKWIVDPESPAGLFRTGKADAVMAFPPQGQELRRDKIGHVIVNTLHDRPWSQYFCCVVIAHRSLVDHHPIATKRALRALLKATDMCALDPDSAARYMTAKGYEPRLEIALEVMRELPYERWREADPEDTLRFHALRLHEVGMIKSTPQKLIAQGTDWRFLNELKQELKV